VGSAEVILLDTHAAVWVAVDNRALGKHSEQILKKAVRAGKLAVSAISFWEIALLVTSTTPSRDPIGGGAAHQNPQRGDD
jgi:PIN domain nuclease of toxin-antitoxin system